MKITSWLLAVIVCVRERQFWLEAVRETFYLFTSSSSGLGVASTAAILRVGHRALCAGDRMTSPQEIDESYRRIANSPSGTFSGNTNA
jgi:hypothetical protein